MIKNSVLAEDLDSFVAKFPFTEQVSGKVFLITGATGLIGSILIRCLLHLNEKKNTNIRIFAVARDRNKVEQMFGNAPVEWLIQDIAQPIELQSQHIDYIIHLANPTSSKYFVEYPVETLRTIIDGTISILDFARTSSCKSMVYASSLEVYGINTEDRWITEDFQGYVNLSDIRSSYNIGKRSAEYVCHTYFKKYGIPVKIARLTQTFGAGVDYNDNRVFAQFARKIVQKQNIELHTSGKTSRMYCYTIDAILAIFYLLQNGLNGEAYNVANKNTYISIREMAEILSGTFGAGQHVVTCINNDMGYAPMTKLKLDTSKIESIGWSPYYSLEMMFSRLIEYYQA